MDATKTTRGGVRAGQGRKPLKAGETTVPVTIRVTAPQKAKLGRLGGPQWVRERIDTASEPE